MTWRTPFTALLTVPASIAVTVGASAVPLIMIERHWGTPDFLNALGTGAIRSLLAVVATGAMTALSLAYSLTLVVFTLAASSIGPRLLKRFTTERVNQVTAGLLGGTFLYALVVIGFSSGPPPRIAAAGAGLLAVASVVQLIWFVRDVAQSVSVDDEIAQITGRLRKEIARLKDIVEDAPPVSEGWTFHPTICAQEAGYLVRPDSDALCDIASKADIVLRIDRVAGDYVLAGTPVMSICGQVSDEHAEALGDLVRLEASRSDFGTVHFSVNLLVEIALRALSPGVNDTFTALAVSDMLSGALADIEDKEPKLEVLADDDGNPRVIIPGIELRKVFGQAFHPLRRAAGHNVLMAQGLARAYGRLFKNGGDDVRAVMTDHARLLLDDLRRASFAPEDIDSVIELFPDELRGAIGE